MFTDEQMQEMYEKHKDQFFDFKDFERAVVEVLNEEANAARKAADKRLEKRKKC